MARPLIKIVIPFAYDESLKGPEFETDMRDSILGQFGLGEVFDISMVFVLQEKEGRVHETVDWGDIPVKKVVFKADGLTYPSTFHQAEEGFKHCLDADYCMYMTANDMLAPLALAAHMTRMKELAAKVTYADLLVLDKMKNPFRCSKPEPEFLPMKWFETRNRRMPNTVPDVCLVDCSILELIPFDAKYKRGSFMIWWYRIWEEYGHLAFAYVNTIGCMFRPHDDHCSEKSDWVNEGYEIVNVWLASRPWRKYTAYAGV